MKIIDFHTHTFEDYVAPRAIDKLGRMANTKNYTDGTIDGLAKSNKEGDIDLSVVLPVSTRIMQAGDINARNVKRNANFLEKGILFFAAIHPEDSNIPAMLSNIKGAGFKGIKLHPIFQDAYIDESSYLRLIDIASDLDLITVIHAGEDICYPGNEWASVKYIINMIDTVKPRNLVLAHMGGWNEWDMVESDLAGADVYFDTAFSLGSPRPFDENLPASTVSLSDEQFRRIVKLHGQNKILFGSDSPWSSQKESVDRIIATGISESEKDAIFYNNAAKLLRL